MQIHYIHTEKNWVWPNDIIPIWHDFYSRTLERRNMKHSQGKVIAKTATHDAGPNTNFDLCFDVSTSTECMAEWLKHWT